MKKAEHFNIRLSLSMRVFRFFKRNFDMKIFRKIIALALVTCSFVYPVKAEESVGYEKNLVNVDIWEIVGKSENDYLKNEGNALIYYDNGAAYNNAENSGFTVYHDFKKPLKGDVSVSFKIKADKITDFQGIKFLSNSIKGVQANAWASLLTNQIMQLQFSGKIWAHTGMSDSIINGYNWSSDYWYNFDLTFHLTGTYENNTVDIRISNDASDYLKIDDCFTNIPISGGGVLESIVICTNKDRKGSTENTMMIKDFVVSSSEKPSADNKIHTITLDGRSRQTFSGFAINAGDSMDIHSDEATKIEIYDKIFRDLSVNSIRIWMSMGVYMQKDENGEIVYDLNGNDESLGEAFKHMPNFENVYFSSDTTIFDIAKRYGITEILLAPSGQHKDGYKVPAWMRGEVNDPYTGQIVSDKLLPEYAEIYAEGLARMIHDMLTEYGVRVTATSIFNELGGCITDREILTIVKTLRRELDERELGYVKILAPEYSTNSLSNLHRFMEYAVNDEEAWDAMYGIANHCYSCAIGKKEADFLLKNPKPLWMTELCEEGELTEGGYSESSHTAGIFLNDLNHMVTDWYYFIGAGAVHEDRLFSVGADLIYTTYAAPSNVSPASERIYYDGYTVRPVYYYIKQIIDAFDTGANMMLCTSSREGEMEIDDYHDNKLYASAGVNPDGTLSIAVLNNTSTDVQNSQFERGGVKRLSDENITVNIDISDVTGEYTEFECISTSPDGYVVNKGTVNAENSVIKISLKPCELLTFRSTVPVRCKFETGVDKNTRNVYVEGKLDKPYNTAREVMVMLAKKDENGQTSDIAYLGSTYPDANGNYSLKFNLPQISFENRILNDYKIYTYHNEKNVNDSIVKLNSDGVLSVEYEIFNFEKFRASISNKYGNDEKYKITIAFYDESDRLISCKIGEEKNIYYENFGNGYEQKILMQYNAPESANKVKVLIWGGEFGNTPLARYKMIIR